ncbi:hypothetical protein [Undibacterium arcticum]
MTTVIIESVSILTCPLRGYAKPKVMLTNTCQFFTNVAIAERSCGRKPAIAAFSARMAR